MRVSVGVREYYVLNNPAEVLAQHLKIEARMAEGNPLDRDIDIKGRREALRSGQEVLSSHWTGVVLRVDVSSAIGSTQFPTFKEWMAERESQPSEAS